MSAESIIQIPAAGTDWGGINLSAHPTMIADNELAWAQDTFPTQPGILSKVRPPQPFTNAVTDAWVGHGPNAQDSFLIQFIDDLNRYHLFIFSGTSSMNGTDQPMLVEVDPRTGAPLRNLFINTPTMSGVVFPAKLPLRRPQWTVYRRKLYIFVGADFPPIVFDSASLDAGGGIPLPWATGNFAPHPAVGCFHQDTLVVAAFNQPGEESTVRFCQIGDPTQLLTDAKSITVGQGDGDAIIAIASTAILGGAVAVDPYLVVFKQRSIWLGHGNLPTSIDTGSMTWIRIVADEGIVSGDTLAATRDGLMWCSGKNVWLLAPGAQEPTPVGNNLTLFLRTLPKSNNAGWHATYFDGIYRLSVPYGDYTATQNASISIWDGNTTHGILAYTPFKDSGGNVYGFQFAAQFWLDLRRGLPKATWWGPMMFPFQSQLVATRATGQEALVSLANFWTITNTKLQIYDWSLETGVGDPFYRPVAQLLRFKEFDFGDSRVEKLIQGVELDIKLDIDPAVLRLVSGNSLYTPPIQVGLYGNGGANSAFYNHPGDQTLAGLQDWSGAGGFVLDSGDLDVNVLADKFVAVAAWPSEGRRFMCRSFQPWLTVVATEFPQVLGGIGGLTPYSKPVWPGVSLASIGIRVRPIGRRPTGSAGSGKP